MFQDYNYLFFVKFFHPCRPTNYIPMIIYERPCFGGVMIYCTIQLNIDFLISTYNIIIFSLKNHSHISWILKFFGGLKQKTYVSVKFSVENLTLIRMHSNLRFFEYLFLSNLLNFCQFGNTFIKSNLNYFNSPLTFCWRLKTAKSY